MSEQAPKTAVERAKERHAKELVAAEREDRIAAAVPPPTRIFMGPCAFGAKAHVRYGDGASKDRLRPWAEAVNLIEAVPPIELLLVRDTGVSFRSRAQVAALPEEKKARWESEEWIAAVTATFQGHRSLDDTKRLAHVEVKVSWYTLIAEVGLVQIQVFCPMIRQAIVYRWGMFCTVHGPECTNKLCRRERKTFFSVDTAALEAEVDGAVVATVERPVRYASGGDHPAEIVVYWTDRDDSFDPRVNGPAIVRALARHA